MEWQPIETAPKDGKRHMLFAAEFDRPGDWRIKMNWIAPTALFVD